MGKKVRACLESQKYKKQKSKSLCSMIVIYSNQMQWYSPNCSWVPGYSEWKLNFPFFFETRSSDLRKWYPRLKYYAATSRHHLISQLVLACPTSLFLSSVTWCSRPAKMRVWWLELEHVA
jgi:hypothetical protein